MRRYEALWLLEDFFGKRKLVPEIDEIMIHFIMKIQISNFRNSPQVVLVCFYGQQTLRNDPKPTHNETADYTKKKFIESQISII